jgi:hypothetical protein
VSVIEVGPHVAVKATPQQSINNKKANTIIPAIRILTTRAVLPQL